MLNVIWRGTALEDLLEITDYIGERNPVAGIEMEDLLTDSAHIAIRTILRPLPVSLVVLIVS